MDICGKDCFILDLDGTVYLGDVPITGTVDFIRRHWNRVDFYFLSNNTSKSPETYVAKLRGLGIEAGPQHLLSPTTPLVDYLREQGISQICLVGNEQYAVSLRAAMPELDVSSTRAQAVVLAYDTELTYAKLCASCLLLRNPECRFLATHPDLVCPSPAGPLPDVGSFLALYAAATGRTPDRVFGKPDPGVLAALPPRHARERTVMVGDRLSTDKALAENAGLDFILVLSGEARREDLATEAVAPWKVLRHLGELDAPPAP